MFRVFECIYFNNRELKRGAIIFKKIVDSYLIICFFEKVKFSSPLELFSLRLQDHLKIDGKIQYIDTP